VLAKAREAGIKILYITVSFDENYTGIKNSKAPLHKGMSDLLIQGTWGAQIHEKVKPQGETVLNKSHISPFTIPEFPKAIEGMETLLLAGVATNFVVEACAREAADRDFEVIILKDCCATMNQEMHDFSLQVLSNLVQLKTADEICSEM